MPLQNCSGATYSSALGLISAMESFSAGPRATCPSALVIFPGHTPPWHPSAPTARSTASQSAMARSTASRGVMA